ncbi:phosphatase PAP2 family protein [Fontimonas sp. SYSU GA230001]|uniref:phosphatase PAP2 family protein n=1 Tax=Fontimonas sp. SYSU GA230001 TaxID=3142450 RepID=UPI0032B3F296
MLRTYLLRLRQRHRQALAQAAVPGAVDRNTNLLLAAAGALAAVALFSWGGYQTGFVPIHDAGTRLPASLLEILTSLGDGLSAVCLAALLARRQPHALWLAVVAAGYATVLSNGLKLLFHAARPHVVLGPALAVIGPELHALSFPSGHTVTAFVAAACFSVGRPLGVRLLLYALACAVALSRVWVGAHWPLDVIAGAAVAGLAVGLAVPTVRANRWGLALVPHLAFVASIVLCAVAALIRVPDYVLAGPLSVTVALLALTLLLWDYVFEPLRGRAAAAGSDQPPFSSTL